MKHKTIVFLCFVFDVFVTCCGTCQTLSAKANVANENFIEFLQRFSWDNKFQLDRTKFPLQSVSLDESLAGTVTTYVKKSDWKLVSFFQRDQPSYGQIYDNFNNKMRDTNERVFAWHGLGNGIQRFYYFKRIDGRWYLIKQEDLST